MLIILCEVRNKAVGEMGWNGMGWYGKEGDFKGLKGGGGGGICLLHASKGQRVEH